MLSSLKHHARRLKTETVAIYLASRDPRLPWYARALAAFVVAHTLSPIDLVPDFIPVLGYLDDLVITPLGIYLVIRLIPAEVLSRARAQALSMEMDGKIQSRLGIAIVLFVWGLSAVFLAVLVYRFVAR
jgi:uncharacterized membrane protein YkvA (DUF1232 family)